MTLEEKLKLLKDAGLTAAGDIVLEKHVEYEIGNVEEGGIGIQINYGSKAGVTGAKKVTKKLDVPKEVEDTFTYRYLEHEDGGHFRLAKLHRYLTKESCGWLDKNVMPDTWCDLFEGKPKPFKMRWTGTQQHLYYLFKLLYDRELISKPDGVGQWEIVGSHFVNEKGRPFTDWNSQKDPKKAEKVISKLANILDISEPLP